MYKGSKLSMIRGVYLSLFVILHVVLMLHKDLVNFTIIGGGSKPLEVYIYSIIF